MLIRERVCVFLWRLFLRLRGKRMPTIDVEQIERLLDSERAREYMRGVMNGMDYALTKYREADVSAASSVLSPALEGMEAVGASPEYVQGYIYGFNRSWRDLHDSGTPAAC